MGESTDNVDVVHSSPPPPPPTQNLNDCILDQRWDDVMTILGIINDSDGCNGGDEENQGKLTKKAADVLWKEAPLEVVEGLLGSWSETTTMTTTENRADRAIKKTADFFFLDSYVVRRKMGHHQVDYLRLITETFPEFVISDDHLRSSADRNVSITNFAYFLGQYVAANTIRGENISLDFLLFAILEKAWYDEVTADADEIHVQKMKIVLGVAPHVVRTREKKTDLTFLNRLFKHKATSNIDWIGPMVNACPEAVLDKDPHGKLALHWAYLYHGCKVGDGERATDASSQKVIDLIMAVYPEAAAAKDNFGRTPQQLAQKIDKTFLTPLKDAILLSEDTGSTVTKNAGTDEAPSHADRAVVLCQGDLLMKDLSAKIRYEKSAYNKEYFDIEIYARERLFSTLVEEFSTLVGIDDTDVIQKAAAVEALAVSHLSRKGKTIIDFKAFDNPAFWYQQELLKLVMRVFHEGQVSFILTYPSVQRDSSFCLDFLQAVAQNGGHVPSSKKPTKRRVEAFEQLTAWLTEGLDEKSYTFLGPVLKPLQSLFNKMFIRRGQTNVNLIGDLVRATLFVDSKKQLEKIIARIQGDFPNILMKDFKAMSDFETTIDFLQYVHDNLKHIPGTSVIPYRFKANSSQKGKEGGPLWFNLNFFHSFPEYHRVGQSEMVVAFELQIGVTEEINSHRVSHVAYERDRILSSQPLLKSYYDNYNKNETNDTKGDNGKKPDSAQDEAESTIFTDDMKDDDATGPEGSTSARSNCTEKDLKIINGTLLGKVATEILVPSGKDDDDRNDGTLLFEHDPFPSSPEKRMAGMEDSTLRKPNRICVNNRDLMVYNPIGDNNDECPPHLFIQVLAGPYELDTSKRYFVESLHVDLLGGDYSVVVGLFAHVGPYMTEVACNLQMEDTSGKDKHELTVVEPGCNYNWLEKLCPLPAGTSAVEVIAYGSRHYNWTYKGTKLALKEFDLHQ